MANAVVNFGTPVALDKGSLPTKTSIYNHSLKVRKKWKLMVSGDTTLLSVKLLKL